MTEVWIRWKDEWRPGTWVRTLSRGRRAGHYEVLVGYQRTRRIVHPNTVKERKNADPPTNDPT